MPVLINEVISEFNEPASTENSTDNSNTLFTRSADRLVQKILTEQQLRESRQKRLKVD